MFTEAKIVPQNLEISTSPNFQLEIPRDKRGRIRWSVLEDDPELLKSVIESGARMVMETHGDLTRSLLIKAERGDLAIAIKRKYPGGLLALKGKLNTAESLKQINSQSQVRLEIPTVLRDGGRRIRWILPGNTPEENLQLGIRNIQGLFLKKFPEFNVMFPRDKEGKIIEDAKNEAREFIKNQMSDFKEFSKIIPRACLDIGKYSYFEGSFAIAVRKSFEPWGLQFRVWCIIKYSLSQGSKLFSA